MEPNSHFFTFAPEIVAPETGGLPTGFAGVAYSGGLIPSYGDRGDAAIDLSNVWFPDRLFALVNHDDEARAGHGRAWLDANTIRVAGQFSKVTEAGQSVAGEFAEGAPWKLSIGICADMERADPPRDFQINGQTLNLATVFRNARVIEVSFVPADADPHTSVTAFSARPSPPENISVSDDLSQKVTQLAATVADLTAQLATEKGRADTAEAALSEQRASFRLSAVRALFEATGRDYQDEAAKPYLTMDEATFAAVAADLRAARPEDESLFSEQAKTGKSAEASITLSATEIYAARAQRRAA